MAGDIKKIRDQTYAAVASRRESAQQLVEAIQLHWPDLPRDRVLQVGAISAWEALRQPLKVQWKLIDIFYLGFLIFTLLTPVLVIQFLDPYRTLAWDGIGIGSTMVLLAATYGVYVIKMAGQFVPSAFEVFQYPPPVARQLTDGGKKKRLSSDRGELSAFVNVVLAAMGTYCGAQAIVAVTHIYSAIHDAQIARAGLSAAQHHLQALANLAQQTGDVSNQKTGLAAQIAELHARLKLDETNNHKFYRHFFDFVWALSFFFVLMDIAVAMFDESHEETFIGASSAAHATIPMFIGIGLMWAFIRLDGDDAHLTLASGALTFQMIMSNILFILIKKNLIFRFLYGTVRSTRRVCRDDPEDGKSKGETQTEASVPGPAA